MTIPVGSGDNDQRYEVRADYDGRVQTIGWTDKADGCALYKSGMLHPAMENPRVYDREQHVMVHHAALPRLTSCDYPDNAHACIFSPCRMYRYVLWRIWDRDLPYCMFVGCNPSIADELHTDATITRCMSYTKDWGYGALCMTNIFALRSPDHKQLYKHDDPRGVENDAWLKAMAKNAGTVCCTWGNNGEYMDRGKYVCQILAPVQALSMIKINGTGQPAHPLYLKKGLKPQPYYP